MHADYHIHSYFSGDSPTPMEDMVKKGISLGLKKMCFTEHMDFDYPYETDFEVDTPSYYEELSKLKKIYEHDIQLLFGIELGLQPHLAAQHMDYINTFSFDFVIGSSHLVHGMDPYYKEYFKNKTEEEAYSEYFLSIQENILAFDNFDVYGHIDYIVRYGPNTNKNYTYEKYKDYIDNILTLLIQKNKGIEMNTAGFKYGLNSPHPTIPVIKKYRELGGEIITIGSDAHYPEHLAYDFHKAKQILTDCGFSYYTEFKGRKASFIKL